VPLALTEQLGARLATRDPERRQPVQETARRYRASLAGLRMSDYQLAGSTGTARLVGRLAVDGLLMLLLLPYALIGVVLGAVPYLLVQATRLIPAAPAVRATILPLVALVVFVAEWVWVAVAAANAGGWSFGAVVALLVPLFVGATVIVGERAVLVWRTVRSWVAARRAGRPITAAREQRADLLEAVREAL
jgi:hypothetical protein